MADPIASASALPEQWQTMLDNIHARLAEALTAADARPVAPATRVEASASSGRREALNTFAAQGLAERAAQAQAAADAADQVLAAGEEFLRWRLAEAEALRQRVAAWAARAIG